MGEEKLFAPLRAAIGLDQAELVNVGAAPTPREVLVFFHAIGVPLAEIWGMSETCGAGASNPAERIKIGTVGLPSPGVELKLADDGELLARSKVVMVGYRNLPEQTAEALDDDGWLHTGDVATIDEDGYVTLIDRKKELIINAAGKNMSPANIEATLKGSSPLIGQACVIGDGRRYNTALLVLDADYAPGVGGAPGDRGRAGARRARAGRRAAGRRRGQRRALDARADQALHAARRRLAARRRRADADDEAQAPPGRREVRRGDRGDVPGRGSVDRLTKVPQAGVQDARLTQGNRPPASRKRVPMPKFGSLRGKMLALILTPVAVAIILVTFLAISRASSDQKTAAFGELQQRTSAEALKVDATTSGALATAASAAAVLGSSTSRADTVNAYQGPAGRQQQVDHGHLREHAAQQLRRQGRRQRRRAGTDKDGSFGPSVTLTEDGTIAAAATADNAKGAAAYVKKPMTGVQEPAAYEGTMYVTYQVPVERGGKVIGFAGTANTLAGLDAQISKTKLLKTGYAFAVSAKGVFVASPDKKNNGKQSLAGARQEQEQPGAAAGRRVDRGRQGRPDRDGRPVHGQGDRPHLVGHRQRRLELPDRRPGVRGARARQRRCARRC